MNLALLAQRAAGAWGERPAVVHGARMWCDYAGFAKRVAGLAGALRGRFGLLAGERVALIMGNAACYPELLFACWHAGLVAVPVNARLHPEEFEYILGHSGARLCFTSAQLEPVLAQKAAGLAALQELIVADGTHYRRCLDAEPLALQGCAGDDGAWLFYTSGTTGKPKGALLTHANLLAMTACYFADVDQIAAGDAILHAAPMSHGSGLYILPHVAHGACNLVPESGAFEPDEIAALLAGHTGVSMFAAPTMVKRLIAAAQRTHWPLDNLKTLVYGGGPMYLADLERAHAVLGYRLAQIYGQGESPMTITALGKAEHADTRHPRYRERLASVGRAQLAVELRVVDEDHRTVPAGEAGEVLVRGASVMAGYWQNPQASAETLRDGWLHTGDLGRLDADGYLTLVDRSRDLIISGGSNIYPREVEEVLLRHPAVGEAAVVGRPDPEWGERVCAFVVGDGTLAAGDLDALCLQHLARFKRPREYRFVDALPKNSYGKVLKRELRALLDGA